MVQLTIGRVGWAQRLMRARQIPQRYIRLYRETVPKDIDDCADILFCRLRL
jgi:hypothetical protein